MNYEYTIIVQANNVMDDNPNDPLNTHVIDGIRIYTGTTKHSKRVLDRNIVYYKNQVNEKLFTELRPSTLTAKGLFTNILFMESEIIDMLTVPEGGYILKIGCNFGELFNPEPNYIPPEIKARVSNRGRKKKSKPTTKRKLQGTGKYFSSQITFEIYNPDNGKIYKIKLFRNGRFQVPGVQYPDMSDLIKPIKILRDYLQKEFMEDVQVSYIVSVMRNYICRLVNPDFLLRINDLELMLKNSKKNIPELLPSDMGDFMDKKKIPKELQSRIHRYMGNQCNSIGIAEIQNNCERYFGIIIKFLRPVSWKPTKRTTIKILRSGKVNFDGGNSEEEQYVLYHWLEELLVNHKGVIYDTGAPNGGITDTDVESIYDTSESESESD